MKHMRYIIEAVFAYVIYGAFKLMPPQMASACGGWLGRCIGPRLGASRRAVTHIKRAFPAISSDDADTIMRRMWDHLGRVIAEYPHIKHLAAACTDIKGAENLPQKGQAIFFGAHLGNWEINAAAAVLQTERTIDITYRAPNNPYVDRLLAKARSCGGLITAYAKSAQGGRAMLKALKDGHDLAILMDQKYNEGLNIPFFAHDAMTTPAPVQFAQKMNCPLIPVQCTRTKGAHFTLTIHPAIPVHDREISDALKDCNAHIERWITHTPEQWLWLHKRWKT